MKILGITVSIFCVVLAGINLYIFIWGSGNLGNLIAGLFAGIVGVWTLYKYRKI